MTDSTPETGDRIGRYGLFVCYTFSMKHSLRYILLRAKLLRLLSPGHPADDILFLDYDGVINTDYTITEGAILSRECLGNVSRLCLRFGLKIVVSSSWRSDPDHREYLYAYGLDPSVVILGKTKELNTSRSEEIRQYLYDHVYINRFIILDDNEIEGFERYQVKTDFEQGFDTEKYEEAVRMLMK